MRTMLYIAFLFLTAAVSSAQEKLHLTINEALELGRSQSIAAKESENVRLKAYWRYQDYRADLLPGISISGTLPSLNRSLNSYQQEDGAYKFVPNNYLSENLNFTIRQAIPFTGGEIYLQSDLERMDQLGLDRVGNFLSVPFSFTLSQPLLAYNPYKWEKKTEPLRYETSRQEYVADIENVNISTVSYYFDLLIAQSDLETAHQNRQNASNLYEVALAREKLGTISDSDLMQLRVSLLNADASVLTSENEYLEKRNILRIYLKLDESVEIVPQVPEIKKIPYVDAEEIMAKARENNPIFNTFRIRLAEAEANLVKAKRVRLPDINLNISIGTTGSHRTLAGAYTNLGNMQIAEIGISIPILDWGKRRGKYIQAESDLALVRDKISREESEFNEKVRVLTENFIDQQKLATIYEEADKVAQERYNIALNRFSVGDISVTDLNYAEQEKDKARRNYIYQLYLSWLYYYNLRYITLYDFETMQPLQIEDSYDFKIK